MSLQDVSCVSDVSLLRPVTLLFPSRLLNANKIHCIRAALFKDLENLALLSLYDNKIQSLAKGTFGALRGVQTL